MSLTGNNSGKVFWSKHRLGDYFLGCVIKTRQIKIPEIQCNEFNCKDIIVTRIFRTLLVIYVIIFYYGHPPHIYRARHLHEFSRLSGDRDFICWFILTIFISLCSELLMIRFTCRFSVCIQKPPASDLSKRHVYVTHSYSRGDWLSKEMSNIKDNSNSAAVYAGSSPMLHNPLFSVHKQQQIVRRNLMRRFYWSLRST